MPTQPEAQPRVSGFAPVDLPPITLGLDVLTPEGDLADGAVREASNVMLHDSGAWDRRPGYSAFVSLAGAHSLWRGANGAFVADSDTLYAFAATGTTALFSGLSQDPVEYTEIGEDVYFTSGAVLRKYTQGVIRRPGVADVLGSQVTVAPTSGGMPLGTYGVAYSLVNDLGEESGLSETIFATGTGIEISGIANATNVAKVNLYATALNGDELFLWESIAWTATAAIVDSRRFKPADKQYLVPMPGGDYVRNYRGRLYVAKDQWLYYSEPFTYGLTHVGSGYMTFGRPITLLEPVENGIFVGFADSVIFLRGTGPQGFEVASTVARGAIAHTGSTAPADQFNPESVGTVAVWLSPEGLAIGKADGSVALPQAGRVRLSADSGRSAVVEFQGIRQVVFTLETLALGASSDSTTLNITAVGVGYAAGTSVVTGIP